MTVAVATMKRCSCCKQELPLEMFNKSRSRKDGLQSKCKECQAVYNKTEAVRAYNAAYAKTEAGKARRRRSVLKRRYGLTQEAYDQMLEAQGGRCAICGTDKPGGPGTWHVDHDHDTGKVRSLLCHSCNTAIGHLKDDPELLRKAANYIELHR